MGVCVSSRRQPASIYTVPIGPQTAGETRVLRNPKFAKSLLSRSSEGFLTIQESVSSCFSRYRSKAFLGTRSGAEYRWQTYGEVEQLVFHFGSWLTQSAQEGEFGCVGLLAKNRPEWLIADFACDLFGRVTVPLYDTLGTEAMVHVVQQTEMELAVCSLEGGKRLLQLHIDNHFQRLKRLVLMDDSPEDFATAVRSAGLQLLTMKEVYEIGAKSRKPPVPRKPTDLFTICYTSGTTGVPKGAQISQFCMMIGIQSLFERICIEGGDVHYSFLPAAHMMERNFLHMCAHIGASVGFSSGDTTKLFDDLAVLKPTFFGTVPRLLKRLHDMLKTIYSGLPEPEKSATQVAIEEKLAEYRRSAAVKSSTLDTRFESARAKLGGRVRMCISGGSAIAKDVVEFLKVTLSCAIVEGYGQTEVPGSICVTDPKENSAGHAGGPSGGVELKLVDVPDIGYFTSPNPRGLTTDPAGEICVRGPNVFTGYFRAEELTREAIDAGGWLHTGDIGLLLPNGALRIIDRKKHLFKLSQGEYISPEKVEAVISNCPLVAQNWVHGETVQDYLVVFIVCDEPACTKWAQASGLQTDFRALLQSEQLRTHLLHEIKSLSTRFGLNSLETPKKLHILERPFTVEQGLLTPSLKLRRAALKQALAAEISQLYASETNK